MNTYTTGDENDPASDEVPRTDVELSKAHESDVQSIQHSFLQAIQQQQWKTVTLLLEHNWSFLVAHDLTILRAAIKALPDDVLDQQPRWKAAGPYVDHLIRGTDATTYRDVVPPSRTAAGLLDILAKLTSKSAGLRAAGFFDGAVTQASKARGLIDTASEESRVAIQYSLAHLLIQWGRSHEFALDEGKALVEYAEAYDLSVLAGDAMVTSRAAAQIAWVHALAGRRATAAEWLNRTIPGDAVPEQYRTEQYLAQAILAADVLDFPSARTHLDKAAEDPHPESWAATLFVRSFTVTSSEQASELACTVAEAIIERPALLVRAGANGVYLAHAIVRLRLLTQQAGQALAELLQYGLKPEPASAPVQLAHAIALAAHGDRSDALKLLRKIDLALVAEPRWALSAQLLQADLERPGDTTESHPDLVRAVEHTIQSGHYLALSVLPQTEIDQVPLPVAQRQILAAISIGAHELNSLALSSRERQVLLRLTQGDLVDTIAAHLFVSPNTVKTQLRSIYRKLGVKSRTDAERIARERHLDR